MTTYRYLTADQWGMRWARPPQREVLRDPECYFHHVGGSAWMDGDAAAIFRHLNEYAINVKGYSALDYDLLVHYDRTRDILTIGEGRGEWMSAATRDRNEEGEAIVVCGNLHLRDILPAEIEGVARAFVIGVERGWIARDAQILGHRDNPAHPGATSCPGQYGYAALPAIRQRVAELLAPPPDPEEDEMPKRLLARLDTNQYHYREGDGIRGEVLRSNEYGYLVEHFGKATAPTYYHPMTGLKLFALADAPVMSETQLDLWVGYVTAAGLDDEG